MCGGNPQSFFPTPASNFKSEVTKAHGIGLHDQLFTYFNFFQTKPFHLEPGGADATARGERGSRSTKESFGISRTWRRITSASYFVLHYPMVQSCKFLWCRCAAEFLPSAIQQHGFQVHCMRPHGLDHFSYRAMYCPKVGAS